MAFPFFPLGTLSAWKCYDWNKVCTVLHQKKRMENWNLTLQMIGLHDDQLVRKSTYACFAMQEILMTSPLTPLDGWLPA